MSKTDQFKSMIEKILENHADKMNLTRLIHSQIDAILKEAKSDNRLKGLEIDQHIVGVSLKLKDEYGSNYVAHTIRHDNAFIPIPHECHKKTTIFFPIFDPDNPLVQIDELSIEIEYPWPCSLGWR